LWRPASSHRGGIVKLTQGGSVQAGCNPFDGAGHLFFSVNGSGDAGDYVADVGLWRQDWFSRPSGNVQLRHHKYRYAAPGWAHTDLGVVGNGGVANEAMVVGLFAAGQYADLSIAAMAWYAADLADATLEASTVLTSYPGWLSLTPVGAWKFNQASVLTSVSDDSGNGADQSAISGTSVTDDPAGFNYGGSIDTTFEATAPTATATTTVGVAGLPGSWHGPTPVLAGSAAAAGSASLAGAIT
ncbi:MAG: hypothetical protein ACM30G_06980, partial [Micromonosporaceae bacterium]